MKRSLKRRNVYRGPRKTGSKQPGVYHGGRYKNKAKTSYRLYILGGGILLLIFLAGLWLIARTKDKEEDVTTTSIPTVVNTVAPSTATIMPTKSSFSGTSEGKITPTISQETSNPDFDQLRALMVRLINDERKKNGLSPVQIDPVAQKAGQEHASEMAELGYLSHWDIDGFGPDYRYSRAGGTDCVQENVASYSIKYDSGTPAPISDWNKVIKQMHANLMASEGHRANILDAAHTHVGLGIAYNASSGEVRVAQEFVNDYSNSSRLPLLAQSGDRLILRGTLSPNIVEPLAILAYEPFPEPMSPIQLNQTGTYISPAQKVKELKMNVTDNSFVIEVSLEGNALPGLYHVQVFANLPSNQQIQIIDQIFEVR